MLINSSFLFDIETDSIVKALLSKNSGFTTTHSRGIDMNINIKAMLLSAFLLPGIGQLYKGEKVKGAVFLLLVNIFLLTSLVLVIKKMGSFLLTARVSGPDEALKLLDSITRSSPEIGWLLAGFTLLWGIAVVDAAMVRNSQPSHPVENL
jgi:TM2 domain-containing membrane protein YozV